MRNVARRGWAVLRRLPIEAKIGIAMVAVIVVVALLAPVIAPYDPNATDIFSALEAPSGTHWFGTDSAGRDVFSRVLFALRLDVGIVLLVTLICFVVGTLLGSCAGYLGRWIDIAIPRIADTVIALPFLVVVMAVVAVLGVGTFSVCLGITCVEWAVYSRLARSEVLALRAHEFLLAARSLGYSRRRIFWRHVMPNIVQPGLTFATIDTVSNLVALAAMSYLGFGAQPPQAELGSIIASGQAYLLSSWWICTLPALVLVAFGLGIGLIGEGLGGWEYRAAVTE